MKLCARCKLDKPEVEFYFDSHRKKLYSYCKLCHLGMTSDWSKRNNDKRASSARVRYRKSPKKFIAASSEWRHANHERIKRLQRYEWKSLWNKCVAGLGGSCACCGETEKTMLEIDHINNDGSRHRESSGGSVGTYNDIVAQGFPRDKFQVLCSNCNHSKRRNMGVCAHDWSGMIGWCA